MKQFNLSKYLKNNPLLNENVRPKEIENISKELAYSMPNHTKPDEKGKYSAEQVQKAIKYIPDFKFIKDKNVIQTIIDKVLAIVNEASPNINTADQIVKQIDDIAKSQGFTKIKTSKGTGDIKYLLTFKRKNNENSDGDDFVELYYFIDEPNKLRIQFRSGMQAENELAKKCLTSKKWEKIFSELSEDSYYGDDDEDDDYYY
jgi:hypothetical protein